MVATSCQILKIKCTKFDFDWGSAPDTAGGAHRPLAYFKEPMSKGRERLFLCIACFNNVLSLVQTDRHRYHDRTQLDGKMHEIWSVDSQQNH